MSSAVLSMEEDFSPRSFSTHELEEVISLSDTAASLEEKATWPPEGTKSMRSSHAAAEEKSVLLFSVPADEPPSHDAAEAAADALGKDLEAMGYDLACRSFIKKRNHSRSSLSHSYTAGGSHSRSGEEERYSSPERPFSDHEEVSVPTLQQRSSAGSDWIEATRSSSDVVAALRSRSSEEEQQVSIMEEEGSILSQGTGPRRLSVTSVQGSLVNATTSVRSFLSQHSQHSRRSHDASHHPRSMEEEEEEEEEEVLVETVTSLQTQGTKHYDDASQKHQIVSSPNTLALVEYHQSPDPAEILPVEDSQEIKSVKKEKAPTVTTTHNHWARWNKEAKKKTKNMETAAYHLASSGQPLLSRSSSSKEDSEPRIFKCPSEGCQPPKSSKYSKFLRPSRHPTRSLGKSKGGSIWSSKSAKLRPGSMNEADDDDEVSSIASSRVAPPCPVISIPMKKVVREEDGRPPRIPSASSQKSKEASIVVQGVVPKIPAIERTGSVESRTLGMTDEGTETESQEKNNAVENHEDTVVVVKKSHSMKSTSSAKEIQKTASKQSRVSSKQSRKSIRKNPEAVVAPTESRNVAVESPFREDTTTENQPVVNEAMEEASKITVEGDDEAEAKEQELMARKLILENIAESNRRFQRSVQARKQLLTLVRQKVNQQEEQLEQMTLPPRFMPDSNTVRSMATAPAQMNGTLPISAPSSENKIVNLVKSTSSVKGNDPVVVVVEKAVEATDATPKIRGGSRLFGFLSISPEKRRRETKNAVKAEPPQMQETMKIKKLSRRTVKKSSMETQSRRGKRFPFLKKNGRKVPSPRNSPKRPITPKEKLSLLQASRVTLIEQEDALEAIEVEAFEKSDGVEAFISPTMLGADLVLEKIVEEGSNDDDLLDRQSTDKSCTEGMNQTSPLILSPIQESSDLEIVISEKKRDGLPLRSPQVALQDLKKVSTDMIASSGTYGMMKEPPVVLKESDSKPKVSFFTAVDKWFFGPLSSKPSTEERATTSESVPAITPVNGPSEGSDVAKKVLSGFERSTTQKEDAFSPTYTTMKVEAQEKMAKPMVRSATSLITGPELPLSSPLNKDRERIMEYLDQELKQREESSLKSLGEEFPRMENWKKDAHIPTHLILNRSAAGSEFDEGSCLTSLPSGCSASRGVPSARGPDDVSAAYTLDLWGEIAEASAIVHRALKNIERQNGGRTPSSELLTDIAINDEVEEALMILSKHATRLGVSESDILKAMISRDESDGGESLFQDQSVLVTELRQSQPRTMNDFDEDDTVKGDGDSATNDGTENSLTIGEEILEAIKMYMAKK
jgi:hypothetical protein